MERYSVDEVLRAARPSNEVGGSERSLTWKRCTPSRQLGGRGCVSASWFQFPAAWLALAGFLQDTQPNGRFAHSWRNVAPFGRPHDAIGIASDSWITVGAGPFLPARQNCGTQIRPSRKCGGRSAAALLGWGIFGRGAGVVQPSLGCPACAAFGRKGGGTRAGCRSRKLLTLFGCCGSHG